MVQWLRLHDPDAGGLSSILGQGTSFHMSQLRFLMPQLRPGAYINTDNKH